MDQKDIIMQGERAKYFIRSERLDFNFYEDDFYLELIYGMQGEKITLHKSDFLYINDQWIFSFPTDDIVGAVKARLVMNIFDPDCPDEVRQEVEEQYIAFVITNPCPQFLKCPCVGGDHEIVYERTERSDIGNRYARLTDRNGKHLRTKDGEYLFVLRNI